MHFGRFSNKGDGVLPHPLSNHLLGKTKIFHRDRKVHITHLSARTVFFFYHNNLIDLIFSLTAQSYNSKMLFIAHSPDDMCVFLLNRI